MITIMSKYGNKVVCSNDSFLLEPKYYHITEHGIVSAVLYVNGAPFGSLPVEEVQTFIDKVVMLCAITNNPTGNSFGQNWYVTLHDGTLDGVWVQVSQDFDILKEIRNSMLSSVEKYSQEYFIAEEFEAETAKELNKIDRNNKLDEIDYITKTKNGFRLNKNPSNSFEKTNSFID